MADTPDAPTAATAIPPAPDAPAPVTGLPAVVGQTQDTLYLVDGSGFIFRAYHALPPLNRPDGTPVNAVLGFTNMLMKLLADVKVHSVAVIFDSKRENFRNAIYPEYKAHRPPPPEDLIPQFELIRQAVDAFNLPCLHLEGYEADDLIATYARLAREAGRDCVIVSSDKDLMQLITDGVGLLDPMKNKTIGPDEVLEKFGVTPDKVVDVQSLAGDSVDNVPGVPGIGIKTAAQLITEYGDLDALLERAHEIKQPKRREALTVHAEIARISRQLVRLEVNVPVPEPLENLTARKPDPERLIGWLREQGFRSAIQKVETEILKANGGTGAGAGGGTAPALTLSPTPVGGAEQRADSVRAAYNSRFYSTEVAPIGEPTIPAPTEIAYELVRDAATLKRWVDEATLAGTVAIDTETDSLSPISAKLVGFSLSHTPGRACYVPLGHVNPNAPKEQAGGFDFGEAPPPPEQMAMAAARDLLAPLLADPAVLKVGHNLKFDLRVLARHGFAPGPAAIAPVDDTMLLSYALGAGAHGHGMDELAQRHLGHTCISFDEVTGTGKNRITFDRVPLDRACAYAAEDADITLRLHQVLKADVLRRHLVTVYETLDRPLTPVVATMENAGILVDRAMLAELSRDFAGRLAKLEEDIHLLVGHPFNVASPKQLGEVLFDEMGLPGGKKGKTGAYSTDSSVLEPLAEQGVEVAQRVLDHRQLAKLKSTYTDALQQQIEESTGRVHTSFALAATATGRLSSTDPNLQNIPIRTEEGRKIRRAFVAPEGHVLLSVDYSQIELRLVAEIAGVPALKQAFTDGIDIHAMTASQVFGVPLDQMTSEIRRKAKAINFGIIYGISGFGLGRQLGIGAGEAGAFIKQYFERFPELAGYFERTKAEAKEKGYVTTLFGRQCWIQGIKESNAARRAFAERQAINAPIQGTAADIIRRAMARVPGALATAGLTGRMLLQVHDELLFEVPVAEVDATIPVVRQVMEGAASLSVPLVAEAGTGHSWGEAH
ncbi:DNA polymerase I [Nitrospirillum iridis]|uniref:DNA polymerase I n=1 Tax=Nitrospirillum iridis TaxID=765888 RepID=A0A7X0EE32_9PROT|nr:DNA polymerase I [Nitrospirillum iridis]MBB6253438.1 DNA polymerase-1 [Nitrospirillum iridis]